MNIGDKVRLTHGIEQGVITRILQGNIVEVEIEDGFKIPVQRSELSVVSSVEAQVFKAPEPNRFEPQRQQEWGTQRTSGPEIVANKGIYMAFVLVNDRELSLHLVNNTDWDLPFMLSVGTDPHHKGLASGTLKPKTTLKVQDFLVKEFEEWGTFVFQAFYYRLAFMSLREPLIKKIKFRANTFFNNKQKAPILAKDAYVYQLDAEESKAARPLKIEPEKIIEKMFDTQVNETKVNLPKPSPSVDLHIEVLTKDFLSMSNTQMLNLQLETFEKQFEAAIANGMDEITFIHGIGNGVLRTELHKKLSKHKNVKFFEDTQKEKFGYGATKIKIK